MREPIRLRRLRAEDGSTWDEVHDRPGYLRRRQTRHDPSPIPLPKRISAVVARHGVLTEITE